MGEYILVIDEGTTSTRAMLFTPGGRCVASEQTLLTQGYSRPGWVEHDAAEIWRKTLRVTAAMVAQGGGADRIAGIGITNQRETVVFWDRDTGEPLAPAIVWQDRRTADRCGALRDAGHEALVQRRTGLILDPYFSATKIGWALEHWPEVAAAGERLMIGTVESWLAWKLTGHHVTDATNASRTALMALDGGWDDALLDLFGVPVRSLPTIVDCAGVVGTTRAFGGAIPVCGLAGDQQAAAIGQACLAPGTVKATFGTGAFVLAHVGAQPAASDHRLLSTVAWQLAGERRYALEGSVFVAGSLVQWLRDSLGLIGSAPETEALARSVDDTAGVYLVPALSGLGAPWWQPEARAALSGLSFAATKAHVARAALEAMSYQAADLQSAFASDGVVWDVLRIDGGMVANDWLAQDLADVLDLPVERPTFAETTALGAAMLAGIGADLFANLDEAAAAMRGEVETFEPKITADRRETRLAGWQKAVTDVIGS
jgi:glycerol kinase